MNRVMLLESLCEYMKEKTRDLIMPTRIQSENETQADRAVEVYKMRLPDSKAANKKAPYILNQVITGEDRWLSGSESSSITLIRSIFCVYCDDEQEGSLMLLNLMERVRINLLKDIIVGGQFELDLTDAKLESLVYPDDTAPYYLGEMISTWKMPAVKREVPELWLLNPRPGRKPTL